jgi:hypothetical protein
MERAVKFASILKEIGPQGYARMKPRLDQIFPETRGMDPGKLQISSGGVITYQLPNGKTASFVVSPDGTKITQVSRPASRPSGNPTRQASSPDNLRKMQLAEAQKAQRFEASMPGAGVAYWNRNGALSRLGHLKVRNENGTKVYELNGRPIAYGSLGPGNGYNVSLAKAGQQPSFQQEGPPETTDDNVIRRSTGQRLLSGAKQVGKELLLSPINAVEGLWAPLQNMAAGQIGKIAGSGVAAYEGNIKHSPDWGAKAQRAKEGISQELSYTPHFESGRRLASLLGNTMNYSVGLPNLGAEKLGKYITNKGYPNAGYAVQELGEDLALMLGAKATETALERPAEAAKSPAGRAGRPVDTAVESGTERLPEKLQKGREARVPSGAQVELSILKGEPLSAEDASRYPDLLKKHERDFVKTSKGSIDFGVIDERISPSLAEGPIRLQRGNEGFGEFHTEGKRAKEIHNEGFPYSRDFVENAVKGASQVWKQPNGSLLLVKKNGKDYITVVELQKASEGDFYTVITVFPTHDLKYAGRKSAQRELLYDGLPLGSLWENK